MPQDLELEVLPLSHAEAAAISRWRYPGPYAFYDRPAGRELESVQYMLDPQNGFHAVRGPSGLVGFCSFGSDGRVPGGTYDDDALDIGAGMDPSLIGTGCGRAFLGIVVDYATRALNAERLRITVASWNERALCASRSVGFRSIGTFRTDKGIEFTTLLREQSRTASRSSRAVSAVMSAIRILELDDVAAFVKIRRLSLSTDPDSFSARPETDAGSNVELARQRFANATPADGPFILGSFVDELVGIVGLIRASQSSARLWGFYVKPECRGWGIGAALVERAVEVARQMPGVVRLELGVADSSVAAIRVYERAGFRATGSRTADGACAMVLELSQDAG